MRAALEHHFSAFCPQVQRDGENQQEDRHGKSVPLASMPCHVHRIPDGTESHERVKRVGWGGERTLGGSRGVDTPISISFNIRFKRGLSSDAKLLHKVETNVCQMITVGFVNLRPLAYCTVLWKQAPCIDTHTHKHIRSHLLLLN